MKKKDGVSVDYIHHRFYAAGKLEDAAVDIIDDFYDRLYTALIGEEDEEIDNVCASFHVDYKICVGDTEYIGRVESEFTPYGILYGLHTAFVDDEVINEVWNDSDSSFSIKDLIELLDQKDWDFGDVYTVIKNTVVGDLTMGLEEGKAGSWIMLEDDRVVNVELS